MSSAGQNVYGRFVHVHWVNVSGQIVYGAKCIVWGETPIHDAKHPCGELSVGKKVLTQQ